MKAVSAQVVSCCVFYEPNKIMQQVNVKFSYMFDGWTDLLDHLLLLKSSMARIMTEFNLFSGEQNLFEKI